MPPAPGASQAYFGTPDVVGTAGGPSNGLAPEFACDPRLGGSAVGEKILNIDCIKVPDFGTNAPLIPPYDLRTPFRMNHDLTLFKTFALHGAQKLQFRAGFFNIFNAAYATTGINNDIDLAARHDLQPPRRSCAERHRRVRGWCVRSRRRLLPSPRSRGRTSAGSTSNAAIASWSSC